jgi:hypothetical protein
MQKSQAVDYGGVAYEPEYVQLGVLTTPYC